MDMRPLGGTGVRVSVLGLGTVKVGRSRGLKYPAGQLPVVLPSDQQVADLLRTAHELGVNLLDTAPAYGTSEERLGHTLAAHRWFAQPEQSLADARAEWVVCTKVGEEFDEARGESTYDFTPAHVRASVERSLRRLKVEQLDIALLHSDGRDEYVVRESGALDELAKVRSEGKVRVIGVSTKSLEGGLSAVQRLAEIGGPSAVMVTYNPDHAGERPAIDTAARAGVGVLVKKGLASGHARDAGASIRFVLAHPGVSSLVIGTTNPGNLEQNVRAALSA
jgi:aryl-alcohol dehydrogenase-like predicted oxidoreductase